jgi:hypothetical protein
MLVQALAYNTQKLKIGQFYQGGIIVFVNNSARQGLIAYNGGYTSDALAWGPNGGYTQTSGYGYGYANTQNAYNALTPASNTALYSAWNATFNGYSDWFLPNRAEITYVYQSRVYFPFWDGGAIWSSEYDIVSVANAWAQNFGGTQQTYTRSETSNRRSIACRYITFT